MQSRAYIQRTASAPHHPIQPANLVPSIAMSGLLIMLPVVVVSAVVSYRKYRSTVLQRRIQRLNRLWQLDTHRKLP